MNMESSNKKLKLMKGDNMESFKKLPDNSIDSVVTDGPYGLSFMGKKWDYDVPTVEFWKEVYRVLKPGGHVLSFGGTRTYHRMVVNIEDAGFEIRDQVMWLYGSGFPKSHNIGKAVDKINGVEGDKGPLKRGGEALTYDSTDYGDIGWNATKREPYTYIAQNEYEGWGTALKPANEPICVARKPLSEKTIAENVIKWGTGGINIDGCRIGTSDEDLQGMIRTKGTNIKGQSIVGAKGDYTPPMPNQEGRFPANIILDETAAELLDLQSVMSASRFFYVAKVSKKERNMGLDGFEEKEVEHNRSMKCDNCNLWILSNNSPSCKCEVKKEKGLISKNTHPTIKPINLMTYLCRLVTPEGGIILDPFMGSGSTGIAACLEGFRFVGMEMDEDYFKIAEARIESYEEYRKLLK